jgi:hypothetical protein
MKIANIVTTNKIDVPLDFNVVNSLNEIIEGLPTLIIGYDYVSKHYPNFDITNMYLGDNLYWTFKKTEKRDNHEEDLNIFISMVYHQYMDRVIYLYVDPIHYRGKTFKKIVRKIYSIKNPITFVNGDMMYIYGDNYVFGVDLKLIRYMGVDLVKIKSKIKSISTVFLDNSDILIEYKKVISILGNKVRFIPILYSIRNGQNDITSIIHIS